MIPQETVQKILDTARIEEVIGDFVTLKRRGADYWACCPFHNEKTPSFHIIPSKGQYYCFGCHKGGSAVGFVMEYEHLSYVEALRNLARKYGIEVIEEEENEEEIARRQKKESLMLVSEYAGKFFHEQLHTEEGRTLGLSYFRSRGLEHETISRFGLGWAPTGKYALTDAAKAAGYKLEYLVETGLCSEFENRSGGTTVCDRFYDRAVFPIHSVSGRVIAFGARTLRSDKTVAKYVNSKESEIYVKNKSLYGIWFAKNEMARKDKCYLVEGYLDVISMHQLGITNVVASSGTSLTEGQIRLIKRFTQNITIMYDGDSAGIHAALRGIDLILKEGMNVKVVLIPDGDDPDSYSRKHSLEEVQAFLQAAEKDFVDFKAAALMEQAADDPMKRADVINDLADTIALIPDAVKRSVYVNHLSDKYRIREGALDQRVSQTRSNIITQERRAAEREAERQVVPPDQHPAGPADAAPALRTVNIPEPTGLEALEENRTMGKSESELLNFILANGTSKLEFSADSDFYAGSEEEAISVFEFIDGALESDCTEFVNSAYKAAYQAYSELYYQGYSQDEIIKRMLDGEDRTVAFVASQLSTDERYDLSVKNLRESMMSKGSWLTRYVPKAILVYQTCRLECSIKELKDQLAGSASDTDRQMEIMRNIIKHQQNLKIVKVKLGREKKF